MNSKDPLLTAYRIRVGHWEACLKAHDVEDAIRMARRQMARELPRLYDVIRSLAPGRFFVEATA